MPKKLTSFIGIIIACVFLYLGLTTKMPEKKTETWREKNSLLATLNTQEYKQSQKTEELIFSKLTAAAMTQTSIYISTSGVIFVISLYGLAKDKPRSAKTLQKK